METYLSISESGRKADAEGVAILEGTPKEVRKWTTNFILLDRLDGHPKSAAFHDGQRFTPTAGEFAEGQVDIDTALGIDTDDDDPDGENVPDEPEAPKPGLSLKDRMRRMRQ